MRFLAFASLLLCGCYVSVPVNTPSPALGTKVEVTLTDDGSQSLARYLGRNVTGVDGRLVSANDSSLSLSVSQVSLSDGDDQFWKGEQVALPRNAIAAIRQKKLSVWRSSLLAGALLAAVATAGSISSSSTGGSRGGGTGSTQ